MQALVFAYLFSHFLCVCSLKIRQTDYYYTLTVASHNVK